MAAQESPKVEKEETPPSATALPEADPDRRGELENQAPVAGRLKLWLAVGEYGVYAIVLLLAVIALYVNVVEAYYGAGPAILARFNSDAEFALAASAILLIAFEFRKERHAPASGTA